MDSATQRVGRACELAATSAVAFVLDPRHADFVKSLKGNRQVATLPNPPAPPSDFRAIPQFRAVASSMFTRIEPWSDPEGQELGDLMRTFRTHMPGTFVHATALLSDRATFANALAFWQPHIMITEEAQNWRVHGIGPRDKLPL
jgi:hypothetical protein